MRTTIQGTMLLLVAALAVPQSAQATAVIYREVFGIAPIQEQVFGVFDWNANLVTAAAGTVADGTNTLGTFRVSTQTAVNGIQGGDNVGQAAAASITHGYAARTSASQSYNRSVIWTDEFSVDRSTTQLDSIQFDSNNASTASQMQGLLRVDTMGTPGVADDIWLVSTTVLQGSQNGSGANFSTATHQTLTLATETWQALSYVPNTSMGIPTGTAQTLAAWSAAGDITGFGLYLPPSGSTVRFDYFELYGSPVPEPAAFSLLMIGAVFFARLRRKRR